MRGILAVILAIISLPTFAQNEKGNVKTYGAGKSRIKAAVIADGTKVVITTSKGALTFPLTESVRSAIDRTIHFDDYNFDGLMDISVSVPDDGYGVYDIYDVFLFDPQKNSFIKPNFTISPKAHCDCLCDLQVNKKDSTLSSSCRGGANWWKDTWRIDKAGKLKYVRSGKVQK